VTIDDVAAERLGRAIATGAYTIPVDELVELLGWAARRPLEIDAVTGQIALAPAVARAWRDLAHIDADAARHAFAIAQTAGSPAAQLSELAHVLAPITNPADTGT
jgi:hypothetical protein